MTTVAEIMTRGVVTLRPESSIRAAAEAFLGNAISGAPVVDSEGRVVGVISETDLVRSQRDHTPAHRSLVGMLFTEPPRSSVVHAEGEAVMVRDLMTSPAIVTEPTSTVQAAALLMIARRVDRLPVVHNGRLVGIVTRTDIVRSMLRDHSELEGEVHRRIAGILDYPESVTIRVEDGIATISGTVERHWQAAALEAAAVDVEGIFACNNELKWRLDERLDPEVRQDPLGINLPE